MNFKNKQQGIALLMSLIMLLVITIIGVASVRMSKIDTQTAGNSMFSLMVFQGAESALGRAASNNDITNIRTAASRDVDPTSGEITPIQIPASYFDPTETMTSGAELTTTAQMVYEGDLRGIVFNNIPNSSDFEYQIFRTTATSRLNATGAQAIHIEGVAVLKAN